MSQRIRELMTPNPGTLNVNDSIHHAAQTMRDHDIGAILVTDASQRLCGIVTDRDLVVRGLAEGRDPQLTTLQQVYTEAIAELARARLARCVPTRVQLPVLLTPWLHWRERDLHDQRDPARRQSARAHLAGRH